MSEETAKRVFRNPKEVFEYLHGAGHKVSQATVYNHRKQGKLVPDNAGGYTMRAIERYVKGWLERDSVPAIGDLETKQKQKKDAETIKLEAQAEHWRIKAGILKGQYVERADYERDLAGRAMLLKADGENFFRAMGPEIASIVDGNPELVPDLVAFCLKRWEKFLGRYSEKRDFSIPGHQNGDVVA